MSSLKKRFSDAARPLEGKTVAFTGRLEAVSRKQAAAIARELGASVSLTVSRDTDLVVAGNDASHKLDAAGKKGIPVVSETEFFELVREQRRINKAAKSKSAALGG